jgi:hypothetical protein
VIDYHSQLVSALSKVLPTHYELALTSNTKTPCISYQERNNYDAGSGDTIGYSIITYTVKVWGNEIAELQKYAAEIDRELRAIGFKRTSSQELHSMQSTLIQKILTYEALALEQFN